MAQTEHDIAQAIKNMETMGWDVRKGTSGHTFVIPPWSTIGDGQRSGRRPWQRPG